jgi:hypothetical protein
LAAELRSAWTPWGRLARALIPNQAGLGNPHGFWDSKRLISAIEAALEGVNDTTVLTVQ